MAKNTLRQEIIAEMRRYELQSRDISGRHIGFGDYYTWWFRHYIPCCTTAQIRRELIKMEREGLVTAFRDVINSTRWRLVEGQ